MISATLTFIKSLPLYDEEKPYFLKIPHNEASQVFRKTNLEYSSRDGIAIEDIREQGLDAFSLAENGFQVLTYQTKSPLDLVKGDIKPYCHEITELISRECNATHVVCYDYRLRRSDLEITAYEENEERGRNIAAPPVYPAHIDHTVEGGPNRIRRHLTKEETEMYMNDKFRARIINVWRTIDNPIEDCPLAICDPQTVDTKDLMATDRVTPDFAVEMYYVQFNPDQRWYWLRNQTTSELLLFVNYDSMCKTEGSKWMTCPHAAFKNPEARKDAPLRSSIEVRLIVFTPIDN
ncbi:uncharacterized protein PGRI_023030 [Penicillium griseofulvum]|uniref:CmcJ-like methyltransferase n=1 Tax=Penicillium patulum TaxID=5078 RepID=A0A135LHJ1_PENPA|nr:uncharacterized protein PGRI_023030 [Penicillium griseofulvum]KXG48433.1 hypothetical protein PGRI_023030 [Penicillium griseofulvum]